MEVILQVEFDGECVNFAGIFYHEDGSKVAIGPGLHGGGVIEIRPPDEEIEIQFEKIFKYPSELHPGERR